MIRLGLTLLGDFQARLEPRPPLRLRARKTQALLAHLAMPPGQPHSRDKLAVLLWGDGSQPRARNRLRETLFALRRALAPADSTCLALTGDTIALNADAVDVDAVTFERLARAGDADALAQAVDLYQGDFLAGFAFRGTMFEEWLMAERERLRELALETLAKLLAHQQRAGEDRDGALRTSLRLIALDPLQEPVHRSLMRLYSQLGRRGAALQQYQLCERVLRRELGVEPEEETRQLYREILRRQSPGGQPRMSQAATSSPLPQTSLLGALDPGISVATDAPLFGRGPEMARLRAVLDDAGSGRGRVVTIVGEAGVGKTRLVGELASLVQAVGRRALVGRCHESEQILAFGPWLDVVKAAHGLADGVWLTALPLPMRRELGRLLPGLSPGDSGSAPSPDYLMLFEGVGLLLGHVAGRQATVLILEDLHWADEMSVRLLAFIGRRLHAWPLLLVVTARAEDLVDAPTAQRTLAELEREAHVASLSLEPLSRPDTIGLVRALARAGSDEAAVARLSEKIWRTSEGNPFVVIEAMRAADHRALSPGPETLSPEFEMLSLPDRVREIIRRHLDRLDDGNRELAALAAVVGRELEFPLLQHASGLGEEAAARGVEELVSRRLLHSVGDHLDFTHDRVREVAYSRILAPRRKILHRRVAEALATLHAHDLEPHHLALGLHYFEGEVWDRAVVHLRRAGDIATQRSANREAVACFERALMALAHVPEGPLTREQKTQAFDLRFALMTVLGFLSNYERAREVGLEAEALARQLEDRGRLGWVSVALCLAAHVTDRDAEAEKFGTHALALGEALEDLVLRAAAVGNLTMIFYNALDPAGAVRIAREAFKVWRLDPRAAHSAGTVYRMVLGRHFLARTLAQLGDFEEGIAHAHATIELAEDLGAPNTAAMAWTGLGHIYTERGDFDEARPWLERSLVQCRERGYRVYYGVARLHLGEGAARSGRAGEALSLFEGALETFMETDPRSFLKVFAWVGLAETHAYAGHLEEAQRFAEQVLDWTRERSKEGWELVAHHALGLAAVRADPTQLAEAERHLDRALALAQEYGRRPLVARCHLDLAELRRKTGEREQALQHLSRATAMFGDMGMRFWLEQAAGERGQLDLN
jgi:DNA-binding SARP family transcriptional activator